LSGKYIIILAPGDTMCNLGSKTSMPETTWYFPGNVKTPWLSYCPTMSLLPAILHSCAHRNIHVVVYKNLCLKSFAITFIRPCNYILLKIFLNCRNSLALSNGIE
jgi:hypothetical protein